MVITVPTSGEGERRRRGGAGPAIGVSIGVHLLILAALGLAVPKPKFFQTDQPPISVTILPSFENARSQPRQAVPDKSAATSGQTPKAMLLPHVHMPRAGAAEAPPSPIAAPSAGEGSNGRPGTSTAPGPLPYDESERGVRAFLRGTVGCESPDAIHLTADEKARCAARFAQDARGGQAFSAIDPEKRGAYAAQAAADEHRRSLRDNLGNSPLIVPCGSGPPPREFTGNTNLGGGCLPDSAIGHAKTP